MGADLYMNKRYKKRLQKMKPQLDKAFQRLGFLTQGTIKYQREKERYLNLLDELHEGIYFRDAYNHQSVMWALGLSWWNDVLPLLDQENKLSVCKTHELVKMIKFKNIEVSHGLLKHSLSMEAAKSLLNNKRINLLSFLSTSIKIDEEIYCSL